MSLKFISNELKTFKRGNGKNVSLKKIKKTKTKQKQQNHKQKQTA